MLVPDACRAFLSRFAPTSAIGQLAAAQPRDFNVVCAALAVEQFGYGFGFAAFLMFMIHVATGLRQTAHYAICTGFMALGMMLPGSAAIPAPYRDRQEVAYLTGRRIVEMVREDLAIEKILTRKAFENAIVNPHKASTCGMRRSSTLPTATYTATQGVGVGSHQCRRLISDVLILHPTRSHHQAGI